MILRSYVFYFIFEKWRMMGVGYLTMPMCNVDGTVTLQCSNATPTYKTVRPIDLFNRTYYYICNAQPTMKIEKYYRKYIYITIFRLIVNYVG